MSVEDNLRVLDAGDAAVNRKDWAAFENIIDESVVLHAPGLPAPIKGRPAALEFIRGFMNALPDFHIREVHTVAQGDWIAREFVNTGTHTGPLVGADGRTIPPTNKRVQFTEMDLFKIEGGKVKEMRLYFDQLGLLAQLGVAPG